MENNISIKKRLLYLSMALIFALGTLFVCFRPLEYKVALADTNSNDLVYNGSPYSTVFTRQYNFDDLTSISPLQINGSNFQIENNFVLSQAVNPLFNEPTYKFYFFSNAKTSGRYHTYLVGYDFDYVDGGSVYQVKSYAYSFNGSRAVNGVRLSDSSRIDVNEYANYSGDYVSIGETTNPDYTFYNDDIGWYLNFKYGIHYYVYFYYLPDSSSDSQYYRALDIYCSGYFNNVNSVNIYNSKIPYSIFNSDFFQGGSSWDSVKFSYYDNSLTNSLSVNVYSYYEPNLNWNTYQGVDNVYNYNRQWYNSPPDLTDNQFYQNGYNAGYENGYDVGAESVTDAIYNNGYNDGLEEGRELGFDAGLRQSSNVAYEQGRAVGFQEGVASANNYTFLGLLGAVVDAPLTALSGLLSFDLLGFNMANFFYALVTCALIIFVIRLLL